MTPPIHNGSDKCSNPYKNIFPISYVHFSSTNRGNFISWVKLTKYRMSNLRKGSPQMILWIFYNLTPQILTGSRKFPMSHLNRNHIRITPKVSQQEDDNLLPLGFNRIAFQASNPLISTTHSSLLRVSRRRKELSFLSTNEMMRFERIWVLS